MVGVRQTAILASLVAAAVLAAGGFGRTESASIFGNDEPDVGNRDICDPDQELVLASFGSCGCCIRNSGFLVSP